MNALNEIRVPAAPNWVRVNAYEANGRPPVYYGPTVARAPSNPIVADLILPKATVRTARAADVFDDGAGRIGFRFVDRGDRKVKLYGNHRVMIGIPRRYVDLIPMGRTACTVTEESGLLVLDLNQFEVVA